MRAHEVEAWVLNIIDRVKAGQPIEDTRVELKTSWISPEDAARRIAGHANAARGQQVLWIIGVDEKGHKVVGAQHQELANWFPQVQKCFESLFPSMMDYNIPVDDVTVVALLFDTDRAPFMVRNPVHGKSGGGPVEYEVPWREGTSTRSAKRADLLRLLSPLQKLPTIEVRSVELVSFFNTSRSPSYLEIDLVMGLYIETLGRERVVIPFHRCSAEISMYELLSPVKLDGLYMSPSPYSATLNNTSDDLLIDGPGGIRLAASKRIPSDTITL